VAAAAGLPGVLATAAAVESFAERLFSVWALGPLEDFSAAEAVTQPALDAGGVRWDEPAVALLVRESGGYPFFLQHFAATTWDVAGGSPIRLHDVELGLEVSQRRLLDSLVSARLDRLSDRERRYVRALADLGPGDHGSGQVAAAMGLAASQVGSARERLIRAGVLYSPARGRIAFSVPLFDRYVRRAADEA